MNDAGHPEALIALWPKSKLEVERLKPRIRQAAERAAERGGLFKITDETGRFVLGYGFEILTDSMRGGTT